MIVVLSPSKTLDTQTPWEGKSVTQPRLLEESATLVAQLRRLSAGEIGALMDISDKLARLNAARFQAFATPFTPENARPALLTFKGDVYEGIAVESYRREDFAFAQQHVRILSGLYGLLKPLDLMQPYRLEMGTRLANPRGRDLYGFWGGRITELLNADLREAGAKALINLASEEYFKAVKPEALAAPLIHILFKEQHKGALKVIGLHAKKARGLMTNFMIKEKLTAPEGLKRFTDEGYRFAPERSTDNIWAFLRYPR